MEELNSKDDDHDDYEHDMQHPYHITKLKAKAGKAKEVKPLQNGEVN